MADRFWVGNGGNWSDNTNHWSDSSGGSPGVSLPTSADDVYFDANSFDTSGQTVTVDGTAFCKDMNWAGVTDSPTFTVSANQLNFYGNIVLNITMTLTNFSLYWYGTSDVNLDLKGKALNNFEMYGTGKVTLTSDFQSLNGIYMNAGTFDANGYDVTILKLYTTGTNTRQIDMGSGMWTLTSTGTGDVWNVDANTNLTINCETSTIVVSGGTSNNKYFYEKGYTYYNIEFTGMGILRFMGGGCTFNNFSVGVEDTNNRGLTFNAGDTYTISGTWTHIRAGGTLSMQSDSSGTAFTLSKASGLVKVVKASIKDSTGSGGATFSAVNSTNVSGNSGWVFSKLASTGIIRLSSNF